MPDSKAKVADWQYPWVCGNCTEAKFKLTPTPVAEAAPAKSAESSYGTHGAERCALGGFLPCRLAMPLRAMDCRERERRSTVAMELRTVTGDDSEQAALAIERLKGAGDPLDLPALKALDDGKLLVDAAGNSFIKTPSGLKPAAPGGAATPSGALKTLEPDNTVRRALLPALAALKLSSPDREIRLSAAEELAKHPGEDVSVLVRKARAKEQGLRLQKKLDMVIAELDLASDNPARRISALELIRANGNVDFKSDLERMTGKDGSAPSEKDPRVRAAASSALSSIETRMLLIGMVGHLFYGVSLGSVLLLAALGLAITFGLMRVINMAHGEMLMIGAYTTFVVQNFFQKNLPGAFRIGTSPRRFRRLSASASPSARCSSAP